MGNKDVNRYMFLIVDDLYHNVHAWQRIVNGKIFVFPEKEVYVIDLVVVDRTGYGICKLIRGDVRMDGGCSPNEELLQSSFRGKRYDQIKEFMVNIWKSKAKYKIFMARRAFNLNYAFMEACGVQKDDSYQVDNIISNTAFLLCAEELADYYRRMGEFPRILIADDLLFHGRGIIKLLDNFASLVVEFLGGSDAKVEKSIVHEELFSAINIYVFAQNREGVLLDCHYALKAERYIAMNELRGLSQQISSALQKCGIANTSYVLSAVLPAYRSKDLKDDVDSSGKLYFQYRGYSQPYYYKYSDKMLKTIRTSVPVNSRRLDKMFTSLVIFGDIPLNGFNDLCEDIAEQFETIVPSSRIAEILRYHSDMLVRPKAQLLAFLLSIESFADFCREKMYMEGVELYNVFLRSDFKKIITNFDKLSALRFEVMELFENICYGGADGCTIASKMVDYVQDIRGMEEYKQESHASFKTGYVEDAEENSSLCDTAEDIFYEVGINAECDASNYVRKRKAFKPTPHGSDVIRLNQYLSIMNRKTDSVKSIGCVFELMDSGLLSMNLERNQGSIQCVLKSGELAMYVLPRRFSVFVHALAIVERTAQKRAEDIKIAISRFIDYLQDYCYEDGRNAEDKDRALLAKLKESKGILLYTYVSGQFFQDWDTELLTEGDRIASIVGQYGGYRPGKYQTELWDEIQRKNHYAFCAKMFIHSDKW